MISFNRVVAIPIADSRIEEIDHALNGHYEDDTLSKFVGFRSLHSGKNSGEDPTVPHLRGTLWSLGWRETGLGQIDKNLPDRSYHGAKLAAERYAKKYAWIGLYTYPKMLEHYKDVWDDRRPPDVQIDPSFPDVPPTAQISIPTWARSTPTDDRQWVRRGIVAVPNDLFYLRDIGTHPGPWIAIHGYLFSRIKVPDRGVFGFLHALLVDGKDADRLVKALSTKDYPGNHWLPEMPEDYYTFAGEIPWNPEFAAQSEYHFEIDVANGTPVKVEILAHDFGWESYHSLLNQAGGAYVPSRGFSEAFDLRGIPQSFDQRLPDGTRATVSLGAPSGFDGHLLYIREDLLLRYAAGRRLIWFIWGERTPYGQAYARPNWLVKAYQERVMIRRRVVRGEQLSPAFRLVPTGPPRRSARGR